MRNRRRVVPAGHDAEQPLLDGVHLHRQLPKRRRLSGRHDVRELGLRVLAAAEIRLPLRASLRARPFVLLPAVLDAVSSPSMLLRTATLVCTALATIVATGCAEDDRTPPPVNEVEDSANPSAGMSMGQGTAGPSTSSGGTASAGGTVSADGTGTASGSTQGSTGAPTGTGTGPGLPGSDESNPNTTDELPSG